MFVKSLELPKIITTTQPVFEGKNRVCMTESYEEYIHDLFNFNFEILNTLIYIY